MTHTPRIAALAVLALLLGAPVAAALPTGSGGDQAPSAPSRPIKNIGQYCEIGNGPTRTTAQDTNGRTLYCVQVMGTDAYVWWPVNEKIPVDPHFNVDPGDDCRGEGELWLDSQNREIVCAKTQNGRLRGNLVWQLAH
ncbi:hypothetical protein ACWIGI_28640 [Nocardia sp. NPDC055321]